jgi:hypothetical protein
MPITVHPPEMAGFAGSSTMTRPRLRNQIEYTAGHPADTRTSVASRRRGTPRIQGEEEEIGLFAYVNWMAVVARGIFNLHFSAFWYRPLFERVSLTGISEPFHEINHSATMHLLPLLAGLVAAHILAVTIGGLEIASTRPLRKRTFRYSPRRA